MTSSVRRRRRISGVLPLGFDNFLGSGALGNAESGQAWVETGGTFSKGSGRAKVATATNNPMAGIDVGVANVRIVLVVGVVPNFDGRIVARRTDLNNALWIDFTNNAQSIQKLVAGGATTIASATTPILAGDTLEFLLVGSSLTYSRNGIFGCSGSDAFNVTATSHGFGGFNAADSGEVESIYIYAA